MLLGRPAEASRGVAGGMAAAEGASTSTLCTVAIGFGFLVTPASSPAPICRVIWLPVADEPFRRCFSTASESRRRCSETSRP